MPYIVKSRVEDVWSGSGVGDPEMPELGRECVDRKDKAHRFEALEDAEDEACTYNCGAFVLDERGRAVSATESRHA